MYQTLSGIGMLLVGCAIIVFSERLTRFTAALHRRTLGIELPHAWSRGGAIFVGALMSLQGLLVLFRLVSIK